jgi:transcription elongation factor Elf1
MTSEYNTVGHYHCENCNHGRMHVLDWIVKEKAYLHQCKMCGHRQFYDKTYDEKWEEYG